MSRVDGDRLEDITAAMHAIRSHAADRSWLRRLITRTATLDDFEDAMTTREDDVKTVICFSTHSRRPGRL